MKTYFIFVIILISCSILRSNHALQSFDQIIFSCNFDTPISEFEACNMSMETTSGYKWLNRQNSTPSDYTGPDFDHTYQNITGYYVYTEASDCFPGDVAKLWTPSLSGRATVDDDMYLTFWYNMYGQHIGTLNVMQTGSTSSPEVLWTLHGDQGNIWYFANVTVPWDAQRLAFVGVHGGTGEGQPFGDIAIDDVIIYDGPMRITSVATTVATTTSTPVMTSLSSPDTVPSTIESTTLTSPPASTTMSTSALPTSEPLTEITSPPTMTSRTGDTVTYTSTLPPSDISTLVTSHVTTLETTTPSMTSSTQPPTTLPTTPSTSGPTSTTQPSTPSTLPVTVVTTTGSSVTTATALTSATADRTSTTTVANNPGSTLGIGSENENRVWGLGPNEWIIVVAFCCGLFVTMCVALIVTSCQLCRLHRRHVARRLHRFTYDVTAPPNDYGTTTVVVDGDGGQRLSSSSSLPSAPPQPYTGSRKLSTFDGGLPRPHLAPDGQSQHDGDRVRQQGDSRRQSRDEVSSSSDGVGSAGGTPPRGSDGSDGKYVRHLDYYNSIPVEADVKF